MVERMEGEEGDKDREEMWEDDGEDQRKQNNGTSHWDNYDFLFL